MYINFHNLTNFQISLVEKRNSIQVGFVQEKGCFSMLSAVALVFF